MADMAAIRLAIHATHMGIEQETPLWESDAPVENPGVVRIDPPLQLEAGRYVVRWGVARTPIVMTLEADVTVETVTLFASGHLIADVRYGPPHVFPHATWRPHIVPPGPGRPEGEEEPMP